MVIMQPINTFDLVFRNNMVGLIPLATQDGEVIFETIKKSHLEKIFHAYEIRNESDGLHPVCAA